MKKLGGVGGLPAVRLVQDVVNGKSGYVLDVGEQRYRVEPQAELNGDQGVEVGSRPDFVIWPWAAGSKRKPVAVFCDGWAYHKDCLRDDARKRSAIIASGRYWVWSVTHADVAAALSGSLETDLEPPLTALSRHDGSKAPSTVPRAETKAFTQHGVTRLLQWLGTATGTDGGDRAVEAMQRNAAWLGFLMIPSTPEDVVACDFERGPWLARLPTHMQVLGKEYAPIMSRANGPALVVGWWPTVLAKGLPSRGTWIAPGIVVLDEATADDEEALHKGWRRWLQLYNTSQFLPGVIMTTASGLDAQDYESLQATGQSKQAQSPAQAALNAIWQQVVGQALAAFTAGLAELAKAGAVPPEVGLELTDAKGCIQADAELAWANEKLAVLRADQADLVEAWTSAGWTVVLLDDEQRTIEGHVWETAIFEALDLSHPNKE